MIHGVLKDTECDKATLLNCRLISNPEIVFEASMWEADWLCHASFPWEQLLGQVARSNQSSRNWNPRFRGLDSRRLDLGRRLAQLVTKPYGFTIQPTRHGRDVVIRGQSPVHRAMRIRNLSTDERSIEHHPSFLITYDHPQPWCVALGYRRVAPNPR